MSIDSGYIKQKERVKQPNGNYKLVSKWTSSTTVEMSSGETLDQTLKFPLYKDDNGFYVIED